MKFVADEGLDRPIVVHLRQDGLTVTCVAEMDPGISDADILDCATRESAILITADTDFGELVFRQQRLSTGVIRVRLAGLPPESKAVIVAAAIAEHAVEFVGNFAVIAPGTAPIRRLEPPEPARDLTPQ